MNTAEVLTPLPKLIRDEFEDRDYYEIVDGVRVELPPMSADSQVLGSRLARHLSNFGIAKEFGGKCNIRMDDTNPAKEEAEYVDSIMADVRWLIDGWADEHLGGAPLFTSDYFQTIV